MRRPNTHDYVGETRYPLVTRCLWDERYDRLEVEVFEPGIRPGDFILWNPRQDVLSIRRYRVAAAYRQPNGRELVSLVAAPPALRIAGERY